MTLPSSNTSKLVGSLCRNIDLGDNAQIFFISFSTFLPSSLTTLLQIRSSFTACPAIAHLFCRPTHRPSRLKDLETRNHAKFVCSSHIPIKGNKHICHVHETQCNTHYKIIYSFGNLTETTVVCGLTILAKTCFSGVSWESLFLWRANNI